MSSAKYSPPHSLPVSFFVSIFGSKIEQLDLLKRTLRDMYTLAVDCTGPLLSEYAVYTGASANQKTMQKLFLNNSNERLNL